MKEPTTIRCHIHGEVSFSGVTDLGRVSTFYCPLCVNETPDTVFRTCDECGNRFGVREDIALEMDAWAAQGEPYVCDDCMPNDPYTDDTPSGELEDAIDGTAERFRDGDDPLMRHLIEAKCRRCDVEFEIQAGETAWCPSCHETEIGK